MVYFLSLCMWNVSTLIIKSGCHCCVKMAHPGGRECEIKIINIPSGLISRYVKNRSS